MLTTEGPTWATAELGLIPGTLAVVGTVVVAGGTSASSDGTGTGGAGTGSASAGPAPGVSAPSVSATAAAAASTHLGPRHPPDLRRIPLIVLPSVRVRSR